MSNDETYMRRCITLAKLGAGNVSPNPMVGSVLVYEGRIIGEGYHRVYGQAHAEVNCILDAESIPEQLPLIAASTLYVSLEPCAHFGKTPPCADLIVSKKIQTVVIGCRDPFKEVDGKGIEKLQQAGIQVRIGVLENECLELNRRFFTFHVKKRPYIILKWAESSNGYIAGQGGSAIVISNEITNRLVHQWRSVEASILVGTNTALSDNPSLTNRFWTGGHPVRIILDKNLRLPSSLKVLDKEVRTIVFNSKKEDENGNPEYRLISVGQPLIEQVINELYRLNILSVLVEGGGITLQSFIDAGLWDEVRMITNNDLLINDGIAAPKLRNATLESVFHILSDSIKIFKPNC